MRRGAGVVEQGCLLSSYTAKSCVVGSNPTLSASSIAGLFTVAYRQRNFLVSIGILSQIAILWVLGTF